tara:strand:- start:483 stop:2159 length:1677 start_codon:yes stop_codon:yes gene_type:complete
MSLVQLLKSPNTFSLGGDGTGNVNLPYGGSSKNIKWGSRPGEEKPSFHYTNRVKSWGDNHIPDLKGGNWNGDDSFLGSTVSFGSSSPNVVDFTLRGGVTTNVRRRLLDTRRITKFLYNSPQGRHFLLRQGALQLLNPQSNARVFNAGVSLLAQVAAAGVSNIRRDGLIPQVMGVPSPADLAQGLLGDKLGNLASKLTGGDYIDIVGEKNTREIKRYTGDPGKGARENFFDVLTGTGLGSNFRLKKRGRNYQKVDKSKQDQINFVSIFEMNNSLGGNKKLYEKLANADFVPFRFEVIDPVDPTKSYWIVFRAFIDTFQDNYSANHNEVKFNGRGEKFYTYNSFDRKISLGFKIAAQSRSEMKPLYQKLNMLVAQTAPSYSSTGRIRTPYMRITLGDYFKQLPGLLTNIGLSWNTNYPWEIKANKGKDKDMKILPHVLDVSLNFQPIHPFTPHNSTSDGNLAPFIGIDGKKNRDNWVRKAIERWTKKDDKSNSVKTKPNKEDNEFLTYEVQPGDTGNALVASLGVRAQDLARWNPNSIDLSKDDWNLKAGATLKYKTQTD